MWTWIVSRSGSEIESMTVRTLRSESWSEMKIFLCCENGSWKIDLHAHLKENKIE